MKLGDSVFPRLKISETNKFCKFKLFPWQHGDFKIPKKSYSPLQDIKILCAKN